MINTLPGNNRTGYCYDQLKRFRQWDTANLHIISIKLRLSAGPPLTKVR